MNNRIMCDLCGRGVLDVMHNRKGKTVCVDCCKRKDADVDQANKNFFLKHVEDMRKERGEKK